MAIFNNWKPVTVVTKGSMLVVAAVLEISNKLPNGLIGKTFTRLLNLVDNHYWNYYSELILLL